jgi:hypothetical protein
MIGRATGSCFRAVATAASLLAAAALGVAFAGTAWATAAGRASQPAWGRATFEPGRLDKVGQQFAALTALACPAPGNCLAGGSESIGANRQVAFVVSEARGSWRLPVLLAGVSSGKGDISQVSALACGSPGNCVAGGSYWSPKSRLTLPFVDRETGGRWAAATAVPGLAQTSSLASQVTAAGCTSPGNCLLAGYYYPAPSMTARRAFVLREAGGKWRSVTAIPGVEALDTGQYSEATAATCVRAACVVGGFYTVAGRGPGAIPAGVPDFVITETGGKWAAPVSLAGADNGPVSSISCSAPDACAAVGGGGSSDRILSSPLFPWVATERQGTWGSAIPVPGTSTDSRFLTGAYSVSCPAAGGCAVAGGYWDQSHGIPYGVQAFAANQVHGTWQPARNFLSFVRAHGGHWSTLTGIACSSAGNCVAGGYYTDKWNNNLPILVSETKGKWGAPAAVPGLALARDLVTGGGQVSAVACPSATHCVAVGDFEGRLYQQQGFVVMQK